LSAISGLFTKAFGNSTKSGREDFAKQMGFGDLGSLYDDLRSLGAEGDKLANVGLNVIGRNDEAGNRQWMADVKQFYDDVANKKTTDAQATQQALQDESDARDRLQSAMEKYGLTIEEMGPKFRQQELDKQAQELYEDFTVLTAAGADANVVLTHMGDSIQEFVTTALKTGSEIPDAMKPMLQGMVDMGTLVDANGNKITDLNNSGIKFSMTQSQGFQLIASKLDQLIRKLTGELPDALESIPSPTVDVGFRYFPLNSPGDYRNEVIGPDYSSDPNKNPYADSGGGFNPDDLPQLKEGGYANWGTGTMAMLHDKEAVMPLDNLMDMMAPQSSLTAEDMVSAMKAAGIDRPNVNFAPVLQGALANEMYDFAAKMWPVLIQVLQNSNTLNENVAGTIGAR
jgi:hypothetical protein